MKCTMECATATCPHPARILIHTTSSFVPTAYCPACAIDYMQLHTVDMFVLTPIA